MLGRWLRDRRIRNARKFDPAALPEREPVTFSDAREDGVMLAEYAARMQLKNRIIVAVLASGGDYDVERFLPEAREVLDDLAHQMRAAADLAAHEREVAADRPGRSSDMHDYRSGDTANLRLRERVDRAVADELANRSGDDDYLTGLIDEARDSAWHDVAESIGARLDIARPPSAVDARYRRARAQQMRLVKNVDLARLAVDRLDY